MDVFRTYKSFIVRIHSSIRLKIRCSGGFSQSINNGHNRPRSLQTPTAQSAVSTETLQSGSWQTLAASGSTVFMHRMVATHSAYPSSTGHWLDNDVRTLRHPPRIEDWRHCQRDGLIFRRARAQIRPVGRSFSEPPKIFDGLSVSYLFAAYVIKECGCSHRSWRGIRQGPLGWLTKLSGSRGFRIGEPGSNPATSHWGLNMYVQRYRIFSLFINYAVACKSIVFIIYP